MTQHRNRRWRIFSVLALMYVLAYFYRISMAVVAGDVSRDLGLTAAMLGTLSGVFFYVYGFVQIPLGPLIDRFGGRLVIGTCGLLSAAGGLVFALAPDYDAALAGRVLIGAGTSCVLMASLKIFTRWFTRAEFATVSGFMVAIGNLGNLSATAPLAGSASLFGWRSSFLAVALIQAGAALLVFLAVRDTPSGIHEEEEEPHPGMAAAWLAVFRDRSFLLLGLLSFAWYGNYMVLQGLWGGPYLREAVGLSHQGAGNVLLCTSLGFITGCLLLGKVTDRLFRSHKRTLLAGQSLLFLLMLLMTGPAERLSRPALAAAFFLLGIAVSSGVTIYAVVREMFPLRIVATGLTSLNFFVLMGAATVQQAMGYWIERFPRSPSGYPAEAYHGAFLIPIVSLGIAILLFLFARETHPERR